MKRLIVFLSLLVLLSLACGQTVTAPASIKSASALSVPTAFASPAPTAETFRVCGAVNVRAEPAARGGVIRIIVNGVVSVYEFHGGWARIGVNEWITSRVLC
jgi:hypothetical protein